MEYAVRRVEGAIAMVPFENEIFHSTPIVVIHRNPRHIFKVLDIDLISMSVHLGFKGTVLTCFRVFGLTQ